MVQPDINYLALLVSAIAAMAIGALWYSPLLFGKKWMELMGVKPDMNNPEMKKKAQRGYVIMFLAVLLMAYVLAHFVDYAGTTDWLGGLQLGFWVWLGFNATVMIGSWLWENKPFSLYLLNTGHYLVALLVMGVILAVWA